MASAVGVLDLVAEPYVALVPFALLVVERLFAILAVPEGFVGGDLAHREPGLGSEGCGVEDDVDFFERAVAGFGVEEVDDGEGGEVGDGEDDIGPVSDVVECYGRDEDDNEVDQPVRCCAECVCRPTDAQRNDFDLVEPGHALPADSKESEVGEDEDRSGD